MTPRLLSTFTSFVDVDLTRLWPNVVVLVVVVVTEKRENIENNYFIDKMFYSQYGFWLIYFLSIEIGR